MACPGELPVYQTFPGPLATQHGALVGYGGVGPVIGKTSLLLFTIAKLSGLWAGVNPRTSSQNAAPSGESGTNRGLEPLCRGLERCLPVRHHSWKPSTESVAQVVVQDLDAGL